MELADGTIARAAAMEKAYGSPVLALRLVGSDLSQAQAVTRVRAAAQGLGVAGDETCWSVDTEPAGVIIRQWGRAQDIGVTLQELALSLESRGIGGRLVVHTPDPVVPRPSLMKRDEELLECHVRLRGERRLYNTDLDIDRAARLGRELVPEVRFFPDEACSLEGLEAALAWIGNPPAGAEMRSHDGQSHRDAGQVRAQIAWAISGFSGKHTAMKAWWESDDSFRIMDVWLASGDVSFVEGGARLAGGGWEQSYDALLEVLRAAAAWASYGFIKRGRSPVSVGRSLGYDWFPALHYGRSGLSHFPYEDVLAPDVFGAQLLGPGYGGRVPAAADWSCDDVGPESVVMVHRDPAAWFGSALPPITPEDSQYPDPGYPTPDALLRGRETFRDILITHDVVSRRPLDPLRD